MEEIGIHVAETYRKTAFIQRGEHIPVRIMLDVPAGALSMEQRALLAGAPAKLLQDERYLALPVTDPYRWTASGETTITWESPLVPSDPGSWAVMLDAYQADLVKARAAVDAHEAERRVKLMASLGEEVSLLRRRAADLEAGVTPTGFALTHKDASNAFDDLSEEPLYQEYLEYLERFNAFAAARAEEAKALAAARRAGEDALREAWVTEHGSEHLRKAYAAGYNCQRMYATERAALEHPSYFLDFDGNAEWKSRSCPSLDALNEAERVHGTVVWLTAAPVDAERAEEVAEEDYDYVFEPCEAVVIKSYMGRYDLVRPM